MFLFRFLDEFDEARFLSGGSVFLDESAFRRFVDSFVGFRDELLCVFLAFYSNSLYFFNHIFHDVRTANIENVFSFRATEGLLR